LESFLQKYNSYINIHNKEPELLLIINILSSDNTEKNIALNKIAWIH